VGPWDDDDIAAIDCFAEIWDSDMCSVAAYIPESEETEPQEEAAAEATPGS